MGDGRLINIVISEVIVGENGVQCNIFPGYEGEGSYLQELSGRYRQLRH